MGYKERLKKSKLYFLFLETRSYLKKLKTQYFTIPVWRSKRERKIADYFLTNNTKKLCIGSGDKLIAGWLNSDLEPINDNFIYLDASKKFPFDDKTIDFINCEQFIEHIDYEMGAYFVDECFRVLKNGGVLRISTPCLDRYVNLFKNSHSEYEARFIEEFKAFHKLAEVSDEIILNYMFYHWGHQYLYTKSGIRNLGYKSNFKEINEVQLNESNYIELKNIERHQEFYGDFLNGFSTMAWEFIK